MFKNISLRVYIYFLLLISRFSKTKKFIYLTFDDGPLYGTEKCFELCIKLNIKATFFFVGSHINSERKIQLVRTISSSYPMILIANHSFSHADEKYVEFYNEFEKSFFDFQENQKILEAKFKIARLPGYSAWVINNKIKCQNSVAPICKYFKKYEYSVIGWDIEWRKSKVKNSFQMDNIWMFISKMLSMLVFRRTFTKNHIVILMHDVLFQKETNLDFLQKIILSLKNEPKIVFETINNYPSVQ